MNRDELIETWFANVQAMQRAWKPRLIAEMGNENMSIGQLGMLMYLHGNKRVPSKQIVADMCMTKGAVAQFLESLDQAGLITREPDPSDRRIVYVRLSKSGEVKAKAMHDRRRTFFTRVAATMSDDELRTMIGVHEKMRRAIETMTEEESAKRDEVQSEKERK